MKCEAYRGEFEEATADVRLSRDASEHAAGCEACGRLYRERVALRGLVGELARVEAPADFEFRLRARIRAAEGTPRRRFFARPATQTASAALVACLVLLVAAGIYIKRPTHSTQQSVASGGAGEVSQPTASEATGARVENVPTKIETAKVSEGGRAADVINASAQGKTTAKGEAAQGRRAGVLTRSFAERAAPGLSRKGIDAGQVAMLSTPVPLKLPAGQQPMRVVLRDDNGASRVVSVRSVSFGSQQFVGGLRTSFRPSGETKEGVW
jgi:hypothetical protein